MKNGNIGKLVKCPFCTSIAVENYCTTLYCPGPERVNSLKKFSETYHYKQMVMNFINKISKKSMFSMQCTKWYGPNNKIKCGKSIPLQRDRKHSPYLVMDCSKHRNGCPFSNKLGAEMNAKSSSSLTTNYETIQQPVMDVIDNQSPDSTTDVPQVFIIGFKESVPRQVPKALTIYFPNGFKLDQPTFDSLHEEFSRIVGGMFKSVVFKINYHTV